jgi:hypothetical protein
MPSQGLVPPNVGQYGTFARSTRSGQSSPGATPRTQTPAPSDGQDTTRVSMTSSRMLEFLNMERPIACKTDSFKLAKDSFDSGVGIEMGQPIMG